MTKANWIRLNEREIKEGWGNYCPSCGRNYRHPERWFEDTKGGRQKVEVRCPIGWQGPTP